MKIEWIVLVVVAVLGAIGWVLALRRRGRPAETAQEQSRGIAIPPVPELEAEGVVSWAELAQELSDKPVYIRPTRAECLRIVNVVWPELDVAQANRLALLAAHNGHPEQMIGELDYSGVQQLRRRFPMLPAGMEVDAVICCQWLIKPEELATAEEFMGWLRTTNLHEIHVMLSRVGHREVFWPDNHQPTDFAGLPQVGRDRIGECIAALEGLRLSKRDRIAAVMVACCGLTFGSNRTLYLRGELERNHHVERRLIGILEALAAGEPIPPAPTSEHHPAVWPVGYKD